MFSLLSWHAPNLAINCIENTCEKCLRSLSLWCSFFVATSKGCTVVVKAKINDGWKLIPKDFFSNLNKTDHLCNTCLIWINCNYLIRHEINLTLRRAAFLLGQMKVNFSLFLTQKRTCPKVLPKYGKEIIYYYSSYLIIYQLKSTLVKSLGANCGMVMIFTTLMRLMMRGFLCRFWSKIFPRLTWTFINPIFCVKICKLC